MSAAQLLKQSQMTDTIAEDDEENSEPGETAETQSSFSMRMRTQSIDPEALSNIIGTPPLTQSQPTAPKNIPKPKALTRKSMAAPAKLSFVPLARPQWPSSGSSTPTPAVEKEVQAAGEEKEDREANKVTSETEPSSETIKKKPPKFPVSFPVPSFPSTSAPRIVRPPLSNSKFSIPTPKFQKLTRAKTQPQSLTSENTDNSAQAEEQITKQTTQETEASKDGQVLAETSDTAALVSEEPTKGSTRTDLNETLDINQKESSNLLVSDVSNENEQTTADPQASTNNVEPSHVEEIESNSGHENSAEDPLPRSVQAPIAINKRKQKRKRTLKKQRENVADVEKEPGTQSSSTIQNDDMEVFEDAPLEDESEDEDPSQSEKSLPAKKAKSQKKERNKPERKKRAKKSKEKKDQTLEHKPNSIGRMVVTNHPKNVSLQTPIELSVPNTMIPDQNGFYVIEPTNLPKYGRGYRPYIIQESDKIKIDPEKFTMSDLCGDFPIGQKDGNFDKFEEIRLKRRSKKLESYKRRKRLNKGGDDDSEAVDEELENADNKEDNKKVFEDEDEDNYGEPPDLDFKPPPASISAPQMQIIGGEIQINTDSTFVDRHRQAELEVGDREVQEQSSLTTYYNNSSFSKHKKSLVWDEKETEQFYSLISQWGPDFSLLSQMIGTRTRREVRNKFKLEERKNRVKLDLALERKLPSKVTDYAKLTGKALVTAQEIEDLVKEIDEDYKSKIDMEEKNREKARAVDAENAMKEDAAIFGGLGGYNPRAQNKSKADIRRERRKNEIVLGSVDDL